MKTLFLATLLACLVVTDAQGQQPPAVPPAPDSYRWVRPQPQRQPLWLHGQQQQIRRQPVRNGLRLFFGLTPKYTTWSVPDYRLYPPQVR